MKTLLEAGAASAAEREQAETALSTSEAQLKAVEAQIRRAARRPRLLPGDGAHRGRRGRHPGARGRQRDEVHHRSPPSTRAGASRSTSTCPSRKRRT